MLVFPAIDLMNGQAVRLQQGRRDSAKVYSSNPPELARAFAAAGAPRLHVVDLDAAFTGGAQNNHETIKAILAATSMDVEVGGGVRTVAMQATDGGLHSMPQVSFSDYPLTIAEMPGALVVASQYEVVTLAPACVDR